LCNWINSKNKKYKKRWKDEGSDKNDSAPIGFCFFLHSMLTVPYSKIADND
jgi:hypothetical protein